MKNKFTAGILILMLMFAYLPYVVKAADDANYVGQVTFIGQWIDESSKKLDKAKDFTKPTDRLGEPAANTGLIRKLAKTFLGWSDKPPVDNGHVADGARLFSPEDKISTAFPDGIPADAKLYGVYFSLNKPDQSLDNPLNLFASNKKGIEELIAKYTITINKDLPAEDFLPDSKLAKVNTDGSIIDIYETKDDVNQINELVLGSEFEMDPAVAMIAYKNPVGGAGNIRPVLSRDYEERYNNNNFPITSEPFNEAYTHVDLIMELDEKIKVPDVIYAEFSGYSWRPLYVFDKNQTLLDIYNPVDEQNLGNGIAAFAPLVKNNNPKVQFGFATNGQHKFTIRLVLRNGDAEIIEEDQVIPASGKTIAETILSNMTLRVLPKVELQQIMPNKTVEELNRMVVRIPNDVAMQLSKTDGSTSLKIKGGIEGLTCMDAGNLQLGSIKLPLMLVTKIPHGEAEDIAIGYIAGSHPADPQNDSGTGLFLPDLIGHISDDSMVIPSEPTNEDEII